MKLTITKLIITVNDAKKKLRRQYAGCYIVKSYPSHVG